MTNRRPVLVLGIGNILLHDEGIGVYTVKELEKQNLPDYVELLDGGTAGADLLDDISEREKVIVVDAVDADIKPGTILRLKSDDLIRSGEKSISLHEFGLAETLNMASRLNCAPKDVVVIAVKPKDISPGLGLSDEISFVLPHIIDSVLDEIECAEEITPPCSDKTT